MRLIGLSCWNFQTKKAWSKLNIRWENLESTLKEQYLAFRGSWQQCGKLFTNNVRTCAEAEIIASIIVHVLRVVGRRHTFQLEFIAQSFRLEMEEPMDNSQSIINDDSTHSSQDSGPIAVLKAFQPFYLINRFFFAQSVMADLEVKDENVRFHWQLFKASQQFIFLSLNSNVSLIKSKRKLKRTSMYMEAFALGLKV